LTDTLQESFLNGSLFSRTLAHLYLERWLIFSGTVAQNTPYYSILYKNEIIRNIALQEKQVIFEAGDILTYGFWIDTIKVGKDIFENSELIILCKVKYEDSYKFRNFINTRLLNNQYSTYRLTFYDVAKKEKCLSLLTLEERNEFKEIIDEWIEE